jgi:hypothetical protein
MTIGAVITLMSVVAAVHEVSHKDEATKIANNFSIATQNSKYIHELGKQLNKLEIGLARVETRLKM